MYPGLFIKSADTLFVLLKRGQLFILAILVTLLLMMLKIKMSLGDRRERGNLIAIVIARSEATWQSHKKRVYFHNDFISL
jgi:hypothetical protein